MKVGLLTLEQKNTLLGEQVAPDWFYYPVLDGNDPTNWVISTQEMEGTEFPEFSWVKTLPLIDWVPPTSSTTENYFSQFFG